MVVNIVQERDEAEPEKLLESEQGPVWEWMRNNRGSMMKRLGTSYGEDRSGTLRDTMKESLNDFRKIFDETGGTKRFEKIEKYSSEMGKVPGKEFSGGKDEYWKFVYNK